MPSHAKQGLQNISAACGAKVQQAAFVRDKLLCRGGGRLPIESRELALRIAVIAKAKKAQQVVILDIRALPSFCDYFVIMSAGSLRQANAIAQYTQEELAQYKIKPLFRISSHDESGWIVMDFPTVTVHIFDKARREFYALEHLWSQAKKVRPVAKAAKKS